MRSLACLLEGLSAAFRVRPKAPGSRRNCNRQWRTGFLRRVVVLQPGELAMSSRRRHVHRSGWKRVGVVFTGMRGRTGSADSWRGQGRTAKRQGNLCFVFPTVVWYDH